MDVAEKGHFCQSCKTPVIDFASMGDDEILNLISSAGKICGRFSDVQLQTLNTSLRSQSPKTGFSRWKYSIAAILVGLFPFIKTDARIKAHFGTKLPTFKKQIFVPDTVAQYKVITGIITAADDTLPIQGVTVNLKGSRVSVLTDDRGFFKLRVPITKNTVIRITYIGYKAQELKIDFIKTDYRIVLQVEPHTLGEVIIKRSNDMTGPKKSDG